MHTQGALVASISLVTSRRYSERGEANTTGYNRQLVVISGRSIEYLKHSQSACCSHSRVYWHVLSFFGLLITFGNISPFWSLQCHLHKKSRQFVVKKSTKEASSYFQQNVTLMNVYERMRTCEVHLILDSPKEHA